MPFDEQKATVAEDSASIDPILAAQAKVEVLNEERLRLEDHRDKAYKEIARLELVSTRLSADVESLSSRASECERRLESVTAALSEADSRLDIAGQTRKSLEKESSALSDRIRAESSKLSDIVVAQREGLSVVGIEREALAKQVASFEDRKTRIRDLISSI